MLDSGPTESKERAGNPGRRQRRLKILRRRAMLWYKIVKGSCTQTDKRFMGKMATTSQPSASSRSARPPVSQPQAVILQAAGKTQSPAGGRLPRRSGTSVT
jgi:hypothetical protein